MPKATIFSEHPAVVIDKNVTPGKRAIIDEFAVPLERRSSAGVR